MHHFRSQWQVFKFVAEIIEPRNTRFFVSTPKFTSNFVVGDFRYEDSVACRQAGLSPVLNFSSSSDRNWIAQKPERAAIKDKQHVRRDGLLRVV